MGGVELLRQLKQLQPATPIIMMTGYAKKELIAVCVELGAEDCIFKPLRNFSEIEQLVRRVLEDKWQDK